MSLESFSKTILNILKIKEMLSNGKSQKDRDEYLKEKTDQLVNNELENGKSTSFSDTVRKEKQKEIERLKALCAK